MCNSAIQCKIMQSRSSFKMQNSPIFDLQSPIIHSKIDQSRKNTQSVFIYISSYSAHPSPGEKRAHLKHEKKLPVL